jgi:hypothetical protein
VPITVHLDVKPNSNHTSLRLQINLKDAGKEINIDGVTSSAGP